MMSPLSGMFDSKDGGDDARLEDESGGEGVAGSGAVEVGGCEAHGGEQAVASLAMMVFEDRVPICQTSSPLRKWNGFSRSRT